MAALYSRCSFMGHWNIVFYSSYTGVYSFGNGMMVARLELMSAPDCSTSAIALLHYDMPYAVWDNFKLASRGVQ